MQNPKDIFIGASRQGEKGAIQPEYIRLAYANRHGLITGATGTGKTVTLQVLAESFSSAGVPVFCADIKGDLSGIARAGGASDRIRARAAAVGLHTMNMRGSPVIFWDIFGEAGHPVRATVSEMGPLLLSRLMNLTPAQEGVLNIAFRVADEQGLLLLDLKDIQAMLACVGEKAAALSTRYGNVSKASVGTVQRELLVLDGQGAGRFFGEPSLQLSDLMRTAEDGRGVVSILAADKLMSNPRLYSTFLLWLMSELFEQLPEVGDPDRPRLVFFFDEAHLLFHSAPKALIERIEQVVRLIRSKGVGIYFISQNPLDIPETVLAQLGNRIQHALRVYTPRETATLKAAAGTFRPNPDFDARQAIMNLATGEALVSTLQEKGVPSMVQKTVIRPPVSQIGPISPQERARIMAASPVSGRYDTMIDRESAYEMLMRAAGRKAQNSGQADEDKDSASRGSRSGTVSPGTGRSGRKRQSVAEAALKSAARSAANSIGRAIAREGVNLVRGVLGNLLGRKNR